MRVRIPGRPATRVGVATATAALAVVTLAPLSSSAAADDPSGSGFTSTGSVELVNTLTGTKATASVAETPEGLKHLTSSKPVPVMIKYDYDALASYSGTIRGLAATSPSVTGTDLNTGSSASKAYLAKVGQMEGTISSAITKAAPGARITGSQRIVYGGVSAVVPGNQISNILAVPGVVAVQRDELRQPMDDASSKFINATGAYSALSGEATAGAGVLLGNLDTGVWPEHPAFAARPDLPAYSGPAIPCNFGDNPLTPANDPFVCNNKLVGGRYYLDTYKAVNGSGGLMYPNAARDSEGHGSHTASTSAGNVVRKVHTLGPVVDKVGGIAPGAQIAEYKVCGPAGCYSSDSAQAVGQAILDGVDAINFSIGGGNNPATDPVEQAFLDAYNAGVFVAASAGNDGPGAATAGHGGPWVTTVAASTQRRDFESHLSLTAGNGDTFSATGASITSGAGPLPVVQSSAAPYSNNLCSAAAPAGTFTGKIVVCARGGGIGRIQKGYNVLQGGAAGMILYNPTLADVETDNHFLPAIHIADGTALLAFLNSHSDITGSFTAGQIGQGQGDVMAAFSSRGPLGNFIKPDITAPGVQILAGATPTPDSVDGGAPGQYWQAIAGTSMSSPHIAGAALLVKAVHPDWTPGQIKSALMTQSSTNVVKEDLVTPADPFDMGAGRVNVGNAIDAPLTISDSATNMAAFTNDAAHSIDLNIPSIDAPTMPGRISTSRTVTNVTGGSLTVTPKAKAPAGTKITFSPASAVVAAGDSATFGITISSTAPVNTQQFATVTFATAAGTLHLPVAFVRKQGSVSLVQSCDDASVPVRGTTTCHVSATNNSFDDQDVTVTTTGDKFVGVTGGDGHSATLPGQSLGVPSIGTGGSPAGGYLGLEGFGGTITQAMGDETVTNFNVPTFIFNGQPYNRVGIDSNGYLVAGGATSADNNCCNLPSGANPAAPNSVMAPFWTDMDGTGRPGVRINVLTDGTNDWIVVQWNVNDWNSTHQRNMQVWIGTNGVQDVSYTYQQAQTAPSGQDYLVGAENSAGDGDMQVRLPAAGDGIVINSTDPTPGGTLSYDVTVTGTKRGDGVVHSEATASGVNGITTADTPVQVVPRP